MPVISSLPDHVVERLERDVRVDRAGPITQKQGEVMNFARVAAFDHQPGPRAQAPADHFVVQARARQQRRDRRQQAVTPRSERTIRFAPRSIAAQACSMSDDERGFAGPGPRPRPRRAWGA